jgi:hypothetical protein
MSNEPHQRIVIAAGVHHQKFAGEAVLLDLDSEQYFALNPSGTLVWEALADGGSRNDAARRLVDIYGIQYGRAVADVEALVDMLLAAGLVRIGRFDQQ